MAARRRWFAGASCVRRAVSSRRTGARWHREQLVVLFPTHQLHARFRVAREPHSPVLRDPVSPGAAPRSRPFLLVDFSQSLDGPVLAGVPGLPDLLAGGEVDDGVDVVLGEGARQGVGGGVGAEVDPDHLRVTDALRAAVGEVVDHDDPLAALLQQPHHVGSDVAGTARHENTHGSDSSQPVTPAP